MKLSDLNDEQLLNQVKKKISSSVSEVGDIEKPTIQDFAHQELLTELCFRTKVFWNTISDGYYGTKYLEELEPEDAFWKENRIKPFNDNDYEIDLQIKIRKLEKLFEKKHLTQTWELFKNISEKLIELYKAVEKKYPNHWVVSELIEKYKTLREQEEENEEDLTEQITEITNKINEFEKQGNNLHKQIELVKTWSDKNDYLIETIKDGKTEYNWKY